MVFLSRSADSIVNEFSSTYAYPTLSPTSLTPPPTSTPTKSPLTSAPTKSPLTSAPTYVNQTRKPTLSPQVTVHIRRILQITAESECRNSAESCCATLWNGIISTGYVNRILDE
eukprot:176657_1